MSSIKKLLIKGKFFTKTKFNITSGSAMAEGPREALVSRNPATTKHLT